MFPQNAFAEKIRSFDVNVTAWKDGQMRVHESINYDFEGLERHGIYRYIPLYAKVGDLYRVIKIKDVVIHRGDEMEKFETITSKEQVSFKIGHPDKTIMGSHVYQISYTVENGIGSNYKTHDEVYWNATGNGWDVVIDSASLTISTDFGLSPDRMICFTGYEGSKDANCEVLENSAQTTSSLLPSQGLTAVASFPVNTFPKSILYKELPKSNAEKFGEWILKNLLNIWIFLNVILPIGIYFWYQKRKNKKRFGPPAVNFDLPEDPTGKRIAPAEAGTIDSATLQRDDVVATLFDLAIRKYIRLEEVKTKKSLAPDSKDQIITKLNPPAGGDGKLNNFEKTLFDSLFATGDKVKLKDLRKTFYTTFGNMEKEVFQSLVEKKFYVKNPKVQRGFLLVFSLWALFTTNIGLFAALFMLSRKLIGRTQLGDEMDYKIDGLKIFLKSRGREYKWHAKNFYTVEQMIPYAVALGYINEFMEQLKIIKPDYSPSWYRGYTGASFYNAYSGLYASASSNVTTSASSSSSGFSGGGSSGGGGGGGGGGSW